jgi:tetratricopeptide (TPR) repeat protein
LSKHWHTLVLLGIVTTAFTAAALVTNAQGDCVPNKDYLQLGTELAALGQKQRAIAAFGCGIQLQPDNAEAYDLRGRAYCDLGEFEEALEDYNRALELAPNVPAYYNNRGWAYYNIGDLEHALSDYNRAIEFDTNFAYPYNNRGLIFMDQARYEEALADFEHAVALGYEPIELAEYNRQNALAMLERGPAPEPIQPAATEAPATAMELLVEGFDAYDTGNYEQSIAAFTRLIELAPDNYFGYVDRARVYATLGDYELAVADYTQAINITHLSNHYTWRGMMYFNLRDYDDALDDFNAAVERNPGNREAHFNRVLTYLALGDEAAAADAIRGWFDHSTVQDMNAIAYSETVTVLMTYGLAYRIPFEAEAGDTITVTARDADAAVVDPFVLLIGADGQPLAENDDSENGLDAEVTNVILEEAGTYTIIVTHAGGGSEGMIEVSLTLSAAFINSESGS